MSTALNEYHLNIMEFVTHPHLLNEQALSETQTTILKSTYGLPLTDSELEIYRQCTGRETYDVMEEQTEVSLIAGRRAGKTGKVGSPIVCYEAFRDHGVPTGEDAYVMLLAPTLKQSKIAFKYIRNYLQNSEILRHRILKVTSDEIILDNHVVIGCYACTHDNVRGRTVIAVVCDEIGFWPDGEESASPAEEVLAALRPGMATLRKTKLIKISTPFAKFGTLWNEFQQRAELDYPVWQVTTAEMNPTVSLEFLEKARRNSEEKYQREYLAQFTDSVNGWISPEILNPCVVRGRRQLPWQPGANYVAAIDPATRGHNFALVVLHQSPDGCVVVDLVRTWTGTAKAPLPFEPVLAEIKDILESYGINTAVGDQYNCDAIQQHLQKLGIIYRITTFGPQTRAKLFAGLKHLMVQRKIEIVDDPDLIRQLLHLQEKKTQAGHIDIRPSSGKDDQAVALGMGSTEIMQCRPPEMFEAVPVHFDGYPASFRLSPESCHLQAPCQNCPTCIDVGECLGYLPSNGGQRGPFVQI